MNTATSGADQISAQPIIVTLFTGTKDTNGTTKTSSWSELRTALRNEPERSDTKDGSAFVFGCIAPDIDGQIHHKKKLVTELHALALDFDDVSDEAFLDAHESLKARGLELAGWPTYSQLADAKEGQLRCRIVLPLSRPVSGKLWEKFWPAAVENLGLKGLVDTSCTDASRLFFHTCPPECQPAFAELSDLLSHDGAALDVDAILAAIPGNDPPPLDLNSKSVVDGSVRVERCPPGGNPFEHAERLCQTIPPAVSGKGGHVATLRLARALVWGLELDAAQAFDLIVTHYNPRCDPPWSESEIAHKLEAASGEDGAPYRKGAILPPPPDNFDHLPKIVHRGGRYWVRQENGEYGAPVSNQQDLISDIVDRFGIDRVQNEKKRAKPFTDILSDIGRTKAEHLAADFATRSTVFDPVTKTMTEGFLLPSIPPAFDREVEAWLEGIAGDKDGLSDLCDYIAGCRQDRLNELGAVLMIVGPSDVGKSMLFTALAKVWGEPWVPLGSVVERFNATMSTCPIWIDDECAALKKGIITSDKLRNLTQERERMFEPKHQEKLKLRGCARLGVTANDLADIRFQDVSGPGAVEAIADRLAIFEIPKTRKPKLVSLLDALRIPGANDVDVLRIAGHMAWIQANVTPRVQRFLGGRKAQNNTAAVVAATAGNVGESAELFELVRQALAPADTKEPRKPTEHDAIIMRGGRLFANTGRLEQVLRPQRYDLSKVQKALAPFRVGTSRPKLSFGATKKVSCWELQEATLRAALSADEEGDIITDEGDIATEGPRQNRGSVSLLASMQIRGYSVKFTGENRA